MEENTENTPEKMQLVKVESAQGENGILQTENGESLHISNVYEEYSEGNNAVNLDSNNITEEAVIETYILNDGDYTEVTYEEVDGDEFEATIEDASITLNLDGHQSNGISTEEIAEELDGTEEVYVTESEYVPQDENVNDEDSADDEQKPLLQSHEKLACNICARLFKTSAGLKRHITVNHTEDEDVKDPLTFQLCLCCGEPVDSAHTKGDYKCEKCDKLFLHEISLHRHCSIEHNEGDTYECAECKKKLKSKQLLIDHMRVHPEVKPFKCEHCKKEFARKYHLERHIVHTACGGNTKKSCVCKICQREFTRKDSLEEHMKTHLGQKKRRKIYSCTHCSKQFQASALLNIHVRTHTGEKPYPCDLCTKRFPSSGAMKKHRRMHTGERPYQCSKCNNRFAAKETLNRHMRTHTGDKPHSCQFCGKAFIQASQLRAHIFHHTGENAYICPHCNRAFNRRLRLTTHIRFMHEGATPLNCSECNKKFFRKEDLARHFLSHTGEKPYKCEVCDKSFAVKSSVKIHMLTHRKEPPCSCETCGRAFIRQDCLMRHIRARHRDVLEDILASAEKKRLQQQLLNAANEAMTKNKDDLGENMIWNELTLTESIRELLTILVDESCLEDFGFPDAPIDKVLDAVIKRCGHVPASEEDFDYIGRMRENAKLLFTVVIDDEAVKALLNNQTVDEVILHVLRLAKAEDTVDEAE